MKLSNATETHVDITFEESDLVPEWFLPYVSDGVAYSVPIEIAKELPAFFGSSLPLNEVRSTDNEMSFPHNDSISTDNELNPDHISDSAEAPIASETEANPEDDQV